MKARMVPAVGVEGRRREGRNECRDLDFATARRNFDVARMLARHCL